VADHATGRNSIPGNLLLALLVGLPALSYPLSWLPKSWAHFRYDCTLPFPEMALAAGLLVSVGWLLRGRARAGTGEETAAILLPRVVTLPLLAVVLSAVASTRFSEHPQFGLALLPRLAGNLAIFLMAAHLPKGRLAELCRWWMLVAVVVAGNGLLRLGSEPEFISTLGNWDFLGTYLAASLVIMASYGGARSVLGSIIVVSAMGFCRSRGAWLALGAVGLLWFLDFRNRFFQRGATRAAIVVAILAGSAFLARPYVLRQWQTEVRPMIWKATVEMIAARPLLGHGLGTYIVVYPKYRLPEYFLRPKATNVTDHAHNELLEIAAEQGLIGLAATLWLWATAVWYGFRACRRLDGVDRRFLWGMFGAMIVLMLHGLLDVDLRYLPNQSLLWLLMGLVVGADATPSRWQRITIHPESVRWCVAGVCLAFGLWILVAAIFRPLRADLQDRQARIAEERGDLRGATEHAWSALLLDPFRLSTRYLLANALSGLPESPAREMAIEQCLRIEELAPDYADVTYNLGQLRLLAGQPAEAITYLRRAVEINPYNAQRRIVLASALRALGQNSEALHQLDCALQLEPDNADAQDLRRKIQPEFRP
jgi:O-antigen ligase